VKVLGEQLAHHFDRGLGAEGFKDEPHHEESKQDTHDVVACDRQVSLRRRASKLDEIKRQRELVAEVGKALTRREDPRRDCGYGGEHHDEAAQDLIADTQHKAADDSARGAEQLPTAARSRCWLPP